MPAHLKVGGLEHTEEEEWGNSNGSYHYLRPLVMVAEFTAPENPVAAPSHLAAVVPASTGNWEAMAVGSVTQVLPGLAGP